MKGRRLAVALVVISGAIVFTASAAFAAPVTKNLAFPLTGTSSTSIVHEPFSCCQIDFDVDIGVDTISLHDNIHGQLNVDMETTINAPTAQRPDVHRHESPPGEHARSDEHVHQGPRTLGVDYTLSGERLALRLRPRHYNKTEGDIDPTAVCRSPRRTAARTTRTSRCSRSPRSTSARGLREGRLRRRTSRRPRTLTGDGVTSHRTLTIAAPTSVPPADLTFNGDAAGRSTRARHLSSHAAGRPAGELRDGRRVEPVNGTITRASASASRPRSFVEPIPPLPDIPLFTVGPRSPPESVQPATGDDQHDQPDGSGAERRPREPAPERHRADRRDGHDPDERDRGQPDRSSRSRAPARAAA